MALQGFDGGWAELKKDSRSSPANCYKVDARADVVIAGQANFFAENEPHYGYWQKN
jgi:hypothetical protein